MRDVESEYFRGLNPSLTVKLLRNPPLQPSTIKCGVRLGVGVTPESLQSQIKPLSYQCIH